MTDLTPELRERVRAAVHNSPAAMTMQLARQLGVPEVEVVRAACRTVAQSGGCYALGRTDPRAFEPLGDVHVIVSNGSVTCEVVGRFGGFSTWGEFFNVQSGSLDMHIRFERLAAAFAVEKPGHTDGVNTLSFQFYDRDGASCIQGISHVRRHGCRHRSVWHSFRRFAISSARGDTGNCMLLEADNANDLGESDEAIPLPLAPVFREGRAFLVPRLCLGTHCLAGSACRETGRFARAESATFGR